MAKCMLLHRMTPLMRAVGMSPTLRKNDVVNDGLGPIGVGFLSYFLLPGLARPGIAFISF